MKSYKLISILFILFYYKTQGQKKVALVVGVSNYEFVGPLRNPVNDANDISTTLKGMGFEVTTLTDPTLKEFNNGIDSFEQKLMNANTCLFYYSGHGAEYNGENYLFAKNSQPNSPIDLKYETLPLSKVLSKTNFDSLKTSIILLDACRNNPFTRHWTKSGGPTEGLAIVNAPNGAFIGFAAAPGSVASDGNARNGTYTEAILKHIGEKDQDIDGIFRKVNRDVRQQTGGKQVPFKTSSLDQPFFFGEMQEGYMPPLLRMQQPDDAGYAVIRQSKKRTITNLHKYTYGNINAFADIRLERNKYASKNDSLSIYIIAIDTSLWANTTPIFVSIHRTNNHYEVFESEYQPIAPSNKIMVPLKLLPGSYQIVVGFYFNYELKIDFPRLMFRKFEFIIE